MEVQLAPFPNWDFFHEDEGIEGLWDTLIHKTVELETRVASAKEEIIKKEDELLTLKDFLRQAMRERDEAESKCQSIMVDILSLQKQDVTTNAKGDEDLERKLVAQVIVPEPKDGQLSPIKSSELPPEAEILAEGKALPEKGKLLQAVMEAGPLLQTLLLAGPLPQWHRPPPRVDTLDIPPVSISRPPITTTTTSFDSDLSCLGHKRTLPHSDFPSNTKSQKLALH